MSTCFDADSAPVSEPATRCRLRHWLLPASKASALTLHAMEPPDLDSPTRFVVWRAGIPILVGSRLERGQPDSSCLPSSGLPLVPACQPTEITTQRAPQGSESFREH